MCHTLKTNNRVLQKHLLSGTGKAVFDDIRLAAQASNKVITELDDGALFQDIVDTIKRITDRADESNYFFTVSSESKMD